MTKTYGAINPQQIIDMFEMRAKIAEDFAADYNAASAWREAADILRNTEFVGWTHDTRIVDDITPLTEKVLKDRSDRYFPKTAMERAFKESKGWRTREDGSMFKPGS